MLKPLNGSRWNYTTASHLLNRAGFGGPPREIEKLVAAGPVQAVHSLVDYEKVPDPTPNPGWAQPDPERAERRRAIRSAPPEERQKLVREEQQRQRQRLMELRSWWLERMAQGPRPFQEKMTLFWHGHFATSAEKVRDAYYMWRQNDLFRRFATGNWRELLTETGKDPAMLVWLDQAQSRKGNPNENYAREVMELFALGEGHYTEKDITEAARALTGWSLDQEAQKYIYRPNAHDNGSKTVLGRTGALNGDDVIEQIVKQPQAATFITAKLWNFFAGEPPAPALNAALADLFRRGGNEFKPLMRAIFLSEEFYDPALIRSQVKSPVQWLVGSVRMLECSLPPAPTSANLVRALGQDLFAPPNVKGWDGGLAWITTNNLLARYNQAATIVQGDLAMAADTMRRRRPNQARRQPNRRRAVRAGGVNVEKLFTNGEMQDKEALIAALEKRLLQSKLKPKQEATLREFLEPKGELEDDEIRDAIRLVMSTPEYQLA